MEHLQDLCATHRGLILFTFMLVYFNLFTNSFIGGTSKKFSYESPVVVIGDIQANRVIRGT